MCIISFNQRCGCLQACNAFKNSLMESEDTSSSSDTSEKCSTTSSPAVSTGECALPSFVSRDGVGNDQQPADSSTDSKQAAAPEDPSSGSGIVAIEDALSSSGIVVATEGPLAAVRQCSPATACQPLQQAPRRATCCLLLMKRVASNVQMSAVTAATWQPALQLPHPAPTPLSFLTGRAMSSLQTRRSTLG